MVRTHKRELRRWRIVRVALYMAIAVEVLAIVYVKTHQREAQRLRDNYDSGMQRFADIWNAQP